MMLTQLSSKLKVPVTERDHIQGLPAAAVTLVEYGDYQCPYCGRTFPVVEKLREQFGDQLRFVFRNFPLAQVHPYAEIAAEAAEVAASQGRFWQMHRFLFEHQNALDEQHLIRYAAHIGIDTAIFTDRLESRAFQDRVREDFMGGARSGVNGTPTFFVNGARHDGPPELEALADAIAAAIRAKK